MSHRKDGHFVGTRVQGYGGWQASAALITGVVSGQGVPWPAFFRVVRPPPHPRLLPPHAVT